MIQNNFCYSHDREQSLHLKDGPQNSICPAGSWQEYAVSCQCIHSSLCLTEKMVVPCTQTHLGLVEVFSVIALFKWLVGWLCEAGLKKGPDDKKLLLAEGVFC